MNTGISSELRKQNNATAFAALSLVFGIISLFSTCCCLPFIFSGLGIMFALLSKRGAAPYSSFAKAGIISSVIGIVLSFIIMFVIFFASMTTLNDVNARREALDAYYERYENQMHEEMPDEIKEEVEKNMDNVVNFFQYFQLPE